ncbi:MAG: hypothetical protein ACE5I9_03965 [Candidatus Methylomirabilales bacterium]
MKKGSNKAVQADNDMRAEYNFIGGVRGKHYHAMQGRYTITIHKADGTTVLKEVRPKAGAVVLEPDVQEYFPDSASVNAALRSLIRAISGKRKARAGKSQRVGTKRQAASGGRPKQKKRA